MHTRSRRMWGFLFSASIATVLAASPVAADDPTAGDFDASPFWVGRPSYSEQDLAVGGQGGFPNYRIPALAVATNGDVLASHDGRPNAQDAPGPNWILQRRSTDGGRTWGAPTVVHAGQPDPDRRGYSDPSYIMDRHTGTIFNFHVFSMDSQ